MLDMQKIHKGFVVGVTDIHLLVDDASEFQDIITMSKNPLVASKLATPTKL
jgi:hypothetical protein